MKAMRLLILTGALLCVTTRPVAAVVQDPVACVQDIEVNFFQEMIVMQALSLYQIPQGLWSPIALSLSQKARSVPERMQRATERMVPNPLEYPMQTLPTAKILIATLHAVFMESMQAYQVNEQPTADLIFNYILSQQAQRFVLCFGPRVMTLMPQLH